MTPCPHLFLQPGCFFLLVVSTDLTLEDGAVILEKDILASEVIDDFSRAILLGTTQVPKKRDFLVIEPVSCCCLGYRKNGAKRLAVGFFWGRFLNWKEKGLFWG